MPNTYTKLNIPLIKKVIITFNYQEESSLGGGNIKQEYIKHAKKIYSYILQKIFR